VSGGQAFWIDEEYDRERAVDGRSRYGEQVAHEAERFADVWGDIAPVAFACTAWQLATSPVLSPGYVRWHRRILEATCLRNGWDGGLTARISIVSPRPQALTGSLVWGRDRGWRDWPDTFGQFVEPTEHDLARGPFLRASLLLQAPVPLGGLPTTPDGPADDLAETARRAVSALVRELNDLVTPIIRQLELDEPAR
jgi:hypothetical protein